MRKLGLAAIVGAMLVGAPATAATTVYTKYLITVTGTGTGAGSAANTSVPDYFTFSNTYTIYTQSGDDSLSSQTTAPIYTFSLTNQGFDINARLYNGTNTYGHLILVINPTAFATTDQPNLINSDINQSASSLTFSNGLYGSYTALSYSIKTTQQSTAFLGHATPGLSFSLGDTATAAPVPEPAAWALMIGGFGLAGAALRRRKAAVSFA